MIKTILVVDDEPALVRYLSLRLEKKGYKIFSAPDGVTALGKAAEILPDLILLDIRLPKMNGFEVCRSLREAAETRSIPIIFLTADACVQEDPASLQWPLTDLLIKPFEIGELYERIEKMSALCGEIRA